MTTTTYPQPQCLPGHCRAQHTELFSYLHCCPAAEARFEAERAAITSYEHGWDRWEGPVQSVSYRPTDFIEPPTKKICTKASKIEPIFGAAYEAEKAAITSYEQGWDRWDGPLYPYSNTQKAVTTKAVEPTVESTEPIFGAAYEAEKAALTSYEEGWDRWDGPVWPSHNTTTTTTKTGVITPPTTPPTKALASESIFSGPAFEAEKAAITSYEDGWDRWDGPVYPYKQRNTVITCETPKPSTESIFSGPEYEAELAAITSYEEGWDRWDGPVWPYKEAKTESMFDSAEFLAEKAAITSYEQGWDRWEGPLYPYRDNKSAASTTTSTGTSEDVEMEDKSEYICCSEDVPAVESAVEQLQKTEKLRRPSVLRVDSAMDAEELAPPTGLWHAKPVCNNPSGLWSKSGCGKCGRIVMAAA
ncbi:hypothetical protein GQ43DRAFT_445340, partial [Delitschia confertaspora ATCC 74209]